MLDELEKAIELQNKEEENEYSEQETIVKSIKYILNFFYNSIN